MVVVPNYIQIPFITQTQCQGALSNVQTNSSLTQTFFKIEKQWAVGLKRTQGDLTLQNLEGWLTKIPETKPVGIATYFLWPLYETPSHF